MDRDKQYPITSIARADIESVGFDTSTLTDEDMTNFARLMAEAYIASGFWEQMEDIATEVYKLKQDEM